MCLRKPAVKKLISAYALSLFLCAPFSVAAQVTDGQKSKIEQGQPYLVMPLQNHSQSGALSWIGMALSSTLADRLESLPALRPAYGERTFAGLLGSLSATSQTKDGGKEAARRIGLAAGSRKAGVRYLFGGHFNRVDWHYEVGLKLFQVEEGDVKEVASVTKRSDNPASGTSGLLGLLDQAMLALLSQVQLLPEAPVQPPPGTGQPGGDGVAAFSLRQALLRKPTPDAYALTLFGRALVSYYGATSEDDQTPDAAELEKIERTLSRVCFIDPKFAEAHRFLGQVHLEMGQENKAMGQYAHALDLRPTYFSALYALGRLYKDGGQRPQAKEVLLRALRLRPWESEARLAYGQVLSASGELAEAQEELQRVVNERPEHVPARRALSWVYAARGQTEQLAAELSRIVALAPDDLDARMDLGAAYIRMDKKAQAIALYEDLRQRKKGAAQVQVLRLLGDLYRSTGETEGAVQIYQRWMRIAPDDPRAPFLLAATYVDGGQESKAERILTDAQQHRRYLAEAWTNLGALALSRGELVRANWYLSRAASRAPYRPRARYNYGLLLDRMGQPDKALPEIRAAQELDPKDPEILFALGVVLTRLSKFEEAQKVFADVLVLHPDHEDAKHNLRILTNP